MQDLDLRNLISVSMDGPNVNWKFFELLQQEHAEAYGGSQLIVVGSYGLHTLHNAFKGGFSMWQLDKVLQALHSVPQYPCKEGRLHHVHKVICLSITILWTSQDQKLPSGEPSH